jgi:hypothetical protein
MSGSERLEPVFFAKKGKICISTTSAQPDELLEVQGAHLAAVWHHPCHPHPSTHPDKPRGTTTLTITTIALNHDDDWGSSPGRFFYRFFFLHFSYIYVLHISPIHIPTTIQAADIFTKPLKHQKIDVCIGLLGLQKM